MDTSLDNTPSTWKDAWRPLFIWLAPVISLIIIAAFAYGAVHVQLSERLQPYLVGFLIFAYLFAIFFVLSGLPCALYSGFLAIRRMIRERKYVLPVLQLLLDAGLIAAWVFIFLKFVI